MVCMTDAARRAKREYQRQWRAEHRESVARSNAKYWQRKAREMGLADADQDADSQADLVAVNAGE